jgi:hypothetical protein
MPKTEPELHPKPSGTSTPRTPAFEIRGPDGEPLPLTRVEEAGVPYFEFSIPTTGAYPAVPAARRNIQNSETEE